MIPKQYLHGFLIVILAAFPLLFSACATVRPDTPKRVALVIGNSAYQNTQAIPNPVNDARDLSRELRMLDFHVIEGLDLDINGMIQILREFEQHVPTAKAAVFYFAGHGIQVSGKNYLVPVDASFDQELVAREGVLESQTIPLDHVIAVLDNTPGTSLVFLDACRDNPLTSVIQGSGENQRALKIKRHNHSGKILRQASLRRGLAQVEVGSAHNMLIAFSTQPGNIALDGKGANSPFAKSLLKYIAIPGLEIRELLTEVRKDVMLTTDNHQVPWDQSSLTAPFSFLEARHLAAPPP
ncbi:MAG: caspase family protein [Sulfurimonadaceae bacterium]